MNRNGITTQDLALARSKLVMGMKMTKEFMRMRRWKKLWEEEGQAIVEMAVTIPLMMTILTGTISFSFGLYRMQQLSNATAATAMLLGAERGLTADPCALAVTTVTGGLPGWTGTNLAYTVKITDSSGTINTYTSPASGSFNCTAGAAKMAANQPVSVTVSYQYTWLPIFKYSPSSSLSTTQTALME